MFVLKGSQRIGNIMRVVKNIKFNPSIFFSKQLFSGLTSSPHFMDLMEAAKTNKINDDEKYDKMWNEKKIKEKELNDLKEKLPKLQVEIGDLKQKTEVDIIQLKQKSEVKIAELKQKTEVDIVQLKQKLQPEIDDLKQKLQPEIDDLKQEIIKIQKKIDDCENKLKENLSEKRRDYYEDMINMHYTKENYLINSLENKENDLRNKKNELINGLKNKENNLINEIKKMENELIKKENDLKESLESKENDLKENSQKEKVLTNEISNLSNFISQDVRSLFKDHKNIIPNTITNQLTLSKDNNINLNFVNRKNELIKAWTCCAQNSSNNTVKHTLLVSGQMFGSGKTVFGTQLFNFKNPYIKSIFEHEFKIDSRAKTVLEKTLPVYIDLEKFADKFDSMLDLISCYMFVSTLNQYFQIDRGIAKEFWKRNKISHENCISLLLSIVGHTLFFHFDEIIRLPELLDLEKGKDPFYEFWRLIVPIQKSGCFIYVSGKSPVLNFFGTHGGKRGSSSEVLHMRFSLFKFEDIKDILWYSLKYNKQNKVTEIGNKLMITTEEQADNVAKWLHEFSTGVPRIVEYSLVEMIKQTNEKKSLINWEENEESLYLNMNKFYLLPSAPEGVGAEEQNKMINLLIDYSITQTKITSDKIESNWYIVDLVNYYGFYLEEAGEGTNRFLIKYPKLWIRMGAFQTIFHLERINNK